MTLSSVGFVLTISLEIPVISVIMAGMGFSGLTSVMYRSVIIPSSKRIAAISMIRSKRGSSPVVSKSNAVKRDKLRELSISDRFKVFSYYENNILK